MTTAAPTVLVTRTIDLPQVLGELERHATVVVAPSPSEEDVAAAVADVDAMIAIRPSTVTRSVIAAARNLRVISAMGSGCDHVDVDAASEHGIPVTSGAGVAAGAVAEFALVMAAVAHRQLLTLHQGLVDDVPWATLKRTMGPGLEGGTLGVVGYGRIGRVVAERAVAGFGADVLVYDPFVPAADTPAGVTVVGSLHELLERSTTVTVHVPLTDGTTGLLGDDELAAIGPEGVLVQASRGGVVDEAALLRALEAGTIKGAVIDVFEAEPPPREQIDALAATGRAILTPHMASFTDKAVVDLALAAVRDVLAVLDGGLPPSVVNRDALGQQAGGGR